MLGNWKNYEEIEENLTLEELQITLEAARKQEHARQKFTAALKGVDLDENKQDEETAEGMITGDDVVRRVEARLRGESQEALSFADIGIAVVEE